MVARQNSLWYLFYGIEKQIQMRAIVCETQRCGMIQEIVGGIAQGIVSIVTTVAVPGAFIIGVGYVAWYCWKELLKRGVVA